MNRRSERARFGGDIEVTAVTVTYDDGQSEGLVGDRARRFAARPAGLPNSISALQMINSSLARRGVTPLSIAGDLALATAAEFGEAHVQTSLIANFEDRPEPIPRDQHNRRLLSAKIDYTVTIRRLTDS